MADISLVPGLSTYSENGDAIALYSDATLSDFESLGDLGGFTLELGLVGGIESDRFTVTETSAIQLDGRRVLRANGTQIATFTQDYDLSQPLLTLTLTAGITVDELQDLILSLAYANVSDALVDGDRTVELTLNSAQEVEVATGQRSLQVLAQADEPVLLASTELFDGTQGLLPTEAGAADDGPFFFALDLTEVPPDFPIIDVPFPFSLAASEVDLRGEAIQGTANFSADSNGTTLTTDFEAYAGISNYRFNYEQSDTFDEILPEPLSGQVFATIGLEPLRSDFPILDPETGYSLSFTSQVISESRTSSADRNQDGADDRAGFSVIVIGDDLRGVELGFWEDRIFIQNDGQEQLDPSLEPDTDPNSDTAPFQTLFTQGEFVEFDTTQLTNYDLAVQGDFYTLLANGAPILSGELRNYSSFDPPVQTILDEEDEIPVIEQVTVFPPNPYAQQNFIFLGDDTPSAQAEVLLSRISVETQPAADELLVSSDLFPSLEVLDLDLDEGRSQLTLSVQSGTLNIGDPVVEGVGSEDISGSGTEQLILTGTREQLNTTLNAGLISYSGSGSETLSFEVISEPEAPDPEEPTPVLGNLSLFSRNSVTNIQDGVLSTESLNPFIRDENWQIEAAGQFTGGDEQELIWRNSRTGQVVMWIDRNTSATALPAFTNLDWQIVGTGQFDDDSNRDLLWYNDQTDEVMVWYLEGDVRREVVTLTRSNEVAAALAGFELVGSGDFDGNGSAELLWINDQNQALISDVEGEAIATPSALPLPTDVTTLPSAPQGIGDYNNDGRDDLAFVDAGQIWLLNGLSTPEVLTFNELLI